MKRNNKLLKITTLFTAFAIGASLIVVQNKKATEVQAAQHINNYALYSYSGNYYNSFNFNLSGGLNGALREALTTLIYPKGWYTYGSQGETHLATQLQYADQDPTNSNNMVYFYTRDSVKKNPATGWNREHCWPQSLSNKCWGESKAGTDILHLRPTYSNTNSSRGNDKYADVNKASPREYNGMTFGYGSGSSFEPLDSVKGDAARIIMYTWTAYKNYYSNLPDITNVFESYDTLLRWHAQDKPDVLEGNRNNYCETSVQKNRNPFVDHPELAWKIFGDQASTSVKNACMEAYPASGYTPDVGDEDELTGISLNDSSLSLNVNQTLTLVASPIPSTASLGVVTWSSSNTSVATVSTSGVVKGISGGTAVITAAVSSSITAQCTITVSSSSNPESSSTSIDFTNKTYSVAKPTSAQTSLSTTVVGDYTINLLNAHNDATGYAYLMLGTKQLSTTNSLVSNKTPVPGPITKIVFNTTTGASTSAVYKAVLSDSEVTTPVTSSTNTLTGKGSIEIIANASDNLRYFGISCTTSGYNGQLSDIEITYATNGGVTPVEQTTKEKINNLPTRASLSYNYVKEDASNTVTDTLTNATTGISGTTYSAWSNKTGTSGAVYAGQSAGGYSSIQLRTSNNNSGIITTESAGNVGKVIVSWNSNTTDTRQLDIYGKNTEYSAVTDLYGSNAGTLLGSIIYGTSTELVISGSYQYIGIKSHSGALYLDSLSIDWINASTSYTYSDVAIRFGGFIEAGLWNTLNEESSIYGFGLLFSAVDTNLTDLYNAQISNGKTIDQAISAITADGNIKNFDKRVSEIVPPEANEAQKIGMFGNDAEKLAKTYMVWSYVRHVDIEDLKESYSAAAYIRLENEIVFFDEVCVTAQGIALKYITDGIYAEDYLEGSMSNLADLD